MTTIILIPAAALTLATALLAALWRPVLLLRQKPAPRYWRHVLAWHLFLPVLHVFGTVPVGLGILGASWVGTRGDEQGYTGPRLAADGTWLVQTRDSIDPEPLPPEAGLEVRFSASDGVPLRGFLVPPRGDRPAAPRFQALLVHGLYRGALEIETPGAMFRDLGGEVLLLELRNHGGSGKARPTFGRDEALDVLAGVEVLRSRAVAGGSDAPPLVLYAVSLGSAAAALAAPRIPELAGLILDAPLDDLALTAERLLSGSGGRRRAQGFPQPWRAVILWSARHFGRVPFDEVRPQEALARLPPTLPVLLIGAGHDVRMPPESVRALFEHLPTQPDQKDLWIVDEAEHGKVWVAQPEAYREHLAAFLQRIAPK